MQVELDRFFLFGTRRNLAISSDECRSLTVCSSVIHCADVVRDLGVLLDSEMSMQRHISKVTRITFGGCVRYEIMSVKQSFMAQPVTSLLSSLASITATPSSPAFLRVHCRRCNEYKTRLLDWCLILIGGHTSVLHYNICTGCR